MNTSNSIFEQHLKLGLFWRIAILAIAGISFSLLFGSEIHNADWKLIVKILVLFSVIGLIYNLSLDLVINENVVKYRLFPFNIVYKSIDIKDIKEIYLREFDPIREFGGWGIRNSFKGNGTSYTLSGTNGLQIILKNNKKLLIEVSDTDQIKHVINSIKPSLQSF